MRNRERIQRIWRRFVGDRPVKHLIEWARSPEKQRRRSGRFLSLAKFAGRMFERTGRAVWRKRQKRWRRRGKWLGRPQHRVISRSEWGARAPRYRYTMYSTEDGVFIHHTVGGAPTTEEAERAEMRAIQSFHMDSRGWADIAYSFVVFPSGRIYEGRGLNTVGAHTAGYNSTSYAICGAGNYEANEPTDEMIAAMRWCRRKYLRLADRPWRPHSAAAATECPGRYLRDRLGDL